MNRILLKSALGLGLAVAAFPGDVLAGGRGGGYGGGRGNYGGGERGGYGGGEERGGYGGESGSHSPSFSQPHTSSGESRSPYGSESQGGSGAYSGRNSSSSENHNTGAAAAGADYSNRNQPKTSNAGAAAAGADYSNRNQPKTSNAGAAAAGADYSNRNQPKTSNAGAAAAGADYSNRNQPKTSNAGAAAAGADYANRNSSGLPNNGAGAAGAAAGAGYANRNNNSGLPYNGAGAAGAGYANRNNGYGYGRGAAAIGAGYWNGNNSAWGGGYGFGNGIGAWGTGTGAYAWGYSNYNNPYYSGGGGINSGNLPMPDNANLLPQGNASQPPVNYSQPISTTAPDPAPDAADLAGAAFAQARDVFKSGDYAQAQQLVSKALTQTPNDTTLHQFLALTLIAQAQYEKAAAPLYAVLSVGPGWNWTTLSGMYPDVPTFTAQLRNLEGYVGANPGSPQARFVLGYVYLCEGEDASAIKQFQAAAQLQPSDTLSAQLVAQYTPGGAPQPAPVPAVADASLANQGKLPGQWTAQPASGTTIALTIQNDGSFTWAASGSGKPAMTIAGSSTLADGTLTLSPSSGQNGPLTGKVTWLDVDHFTFKLAGGPPTDPGLKFGR